MGCLNEVLMEETLLKEIGSSLTFFLEISYTDSLDNIA